MIIIIIIIYFNFKWVFTRWQWYYNKTQHTNKHITPNSAARLDKTYLKSLDWFCE
jgi:hypothetical protein